MEVPVSRLANILCSLFIARGRTYKPDSFEAGYFDRYHAMTPEQRQDYRYARAG